jgi:hypothetical protein
MRYEIPAVIVVDADSAPQAARMATELSRALRNDERPAGSSSDRGLAATGAARLAGRDREAEPLCRHVERIHERRPPTDSRAGRR